MIISSLESAHLAYNKRPVSHSCSVTLDCSSALLSGVWESAPLALPSLTCRLKQQALSETHSSVAQANVQGEQVETL